MENLIELNKQNKWLFKQFTIINRTASIIYSAIQGGIDLNFYNCYKEYEDGKFGNIKENSAFETAITMYEYFTGNDAWDVIRDLEEAFGESTLSNLEYSTILKWEHTLVDFEL